MMPAAFTFTPIVWPPGTTFRSGTIWSLTVLNGILPNSFRRSSVSPLLFGWMDTGSFRLTGNVDRVEPLTAATLGSSVPWA